MSRPGAHDWGDNPPPTGPRGRSNKKRRADTLEHWARPESQSHRPDLRSPSPKRHKPLPPSDSEASYHASNGIVIKGSAAGARRHSFEAEDDDARGPPAQLGAYQVRRQASENTEESAAGEAKMVDSDFQEKLRFPNYFPDAASLVTKEIKDQLDCLEEFLGLPQLVHAQERWVPIFEGICGQVTRIEKFCNHINKERRALHGEKMDCSRQLAKFEKDYRTHITDMEGFKQSAAKLEKDTEIHKKQASKLEKEVDAYKKQVIKLEEDNKKQAAEMEQISKLAQYLSTQVEETETYKKKAAKLEEDSSQRAADMESYKNQVSKLKEDNSKLAVEMEGYKKQIIELEKDKKDPAVGSEDGQLQVCETEGVKIPVVVSGAYRLKARKTPAGSRDWSMETEDRMPKSPNKDRSMEVEGYKARIRNLEETCKQQSSQIEGFQMEIDRWQREFWNQGVEKEGYKLNIGRLQRDIGHLQQDKGKLQQDLSNAASQRAKHVTGLRQAEEKLRGIKKTDSRAELVKALDEKQKLQLAAAEEEKRYASLKANYDSQATKCQSLERDVADQKKKFTTIRVEYQRSIDKIKAEKQELERQILESQKIPNGNSRQSPVGRDTVAPDIDQLIAGMEPMIPPADASKQPGKPLARSKQHPDVDHLMGGSEPTTSPGNSSVPPEGIQATAPTAGTGVVSTSAPPSQSKDGQVHRVQDNTQNNDQGNVRGSTETLKLQAMLREKDERLKQLTAEKNNLQSLLDEKVTQIQKQLQAEKNRLQQQAQGFDDKSGSATINAILKARVDKLLVKEKERDTDIRQLKDANFRLECLVEEKEDKFKQLVAINVGLHGMVQEKTAKIQKLEDEKNQHEVDIQAKVDQIQALEVKVNETENQLRGEVEKTTKLRQIIAHREAEISTLRAASSLPDTPLSAVSSGGFQNQMPLVTSSDGGPHGSGLSAHRESTVFIKRELPDPRCELLQSGPQLATAQERGEDQDLRKGIVSLLANLFDITPGQDIDTVVRYVSCLGTALDNATTDVAPMSDAWKLKNVWAQDSSTGQAGQSNRQDTTIAGRFAHLCLLLSAVRDGQRNDMSTCQLMGDLALHLLSADLSQLPLAGMAFLDCMTSSRPTATPQRVKAREGLMAILICELCSHLQRVFPTASKSHWGIREVLGKTEDEVPETSPIWKLAAILAEEDTRADPLEMRKRLAQTCGDKFSFFYHKDENGKEREVGLLSCGSGNDTEDDANSQIFLMLEFEERWIRLVDCSLAYFKSNRAAPLMLDLVIAREDAERQKGVELFKIEAAPKDVAAFWLKHICYGG